jgi:hypothetical protein
VTAQRLFDLLPSLHRVRDAERDGALEDFLSMLDEELERLRDDIDGLYDNWFIETCDDWVVPYIGDLLGVQGLRAIEGARISQRGLVANTIAYRRRKGTAAVMEDMARDVTGWPAKAVEFFSLLGWTQNVNHIRLGAGGTVNLTSASRLELIDSPFDVAPHTADVRHVDVARGRHNIPHVGIFLWRLGSYVVERTTAQPIPGSPGCYRFDPLGLDTQLFNVERPERDVSQLAAEPNVPGPIRARALHDELHGVMFGEDRYFSRVDPVLRVFIDAGGDSDHLDPGEITICDLEPPDRPIPSDVRVAVDPERGRLQVPEATGGTLVEVTWAYGAAGDIGAGPYDRSTSIQELFETDDPTRRVGPVTWQRGVWRDSPTEPGVTSTPPQPAQRVGLTRSIEASLAQWETGPRKDVGLIVVMDSRTYVGDLTIRIPGGTALVLAAGDWPDEDASPTRALRRLGRIDPSGPRPHILGNITVRTTPGPAGSRPGVLVLDGLLVQGAITLVPGSLGRLRIANCTVLPDPAASSDPPPLALEVQAGGAASTRHPDLDIEIVRSSLGVVAVTEYVDNVTIRDSILRGGDPAAGLDPVPALQAGDAHLERVTILGSARLRTIEASECIFRDAIQVERRQSGCVRYSYVPSGSLVPRRFRCVPAAGDVEHTPSFVSMNPGDPGYAQLDRATSTTISQGAEDGNEMGAYHFVCASHRVTHLRTRLDDYTRFGVETGVFFVT